jgi:hypothetical protein
LGDEQIDHDPDLLRKLERAGMSAVDSRAISERLTTAALSLRSAVEDKNWASEDPATVNVSPTATSSSSDFELVELTCDGVTVKCSKNHISKLRRMYDAVHRDCEETCAGLSAGEKDGKTKRNKLDAGATDVFYWHVYCTLARVLALQGGHEKAGGNQVCKSLLKGGKRFT